MTAEHWYTASGGEVEHFLVDPDNHDDLFFLMVQGEDVPHARFTADEAVRLASELLRETFPAEDWRLVATAIRQTNFSAEQARLDESEAR